ncbi:MAG: ERAP1-like C-terminal domain-containing protein [Pyrinomonadaceae bacterium]|nr:ERAP1-like C-terminal domain-containing protein [Pyrinomonadaceae bacterium]
MSLRTLLTVVALILISLSSTYANEQASSPPIIEPGVSRELARHRAAHYSNVRYKLDIELAKDAEQMRGAAEIRVTLDDGAGDLILDWRDTPRDGQPQRRVWDIEVNGQKANDAQLINEHIRIPNARLVKGENIVRLKFESPVSASGSAVTRYRDREDNREYIYTLFVPSDASTTFPCFDQPDLKARFRLEVTTPETWKVISNTNVSEKVEIATLDPGTPPATRSGFVFGETEPLSTYQFAFAAGEFAEFKDSSSPQGTRVFVRQSKAERMKKELDEVFRLNRESLKFFAGYFDYRFPFSKYDLVIVPEFAYGGMEHAGATFLREEAILFPSDPTANDLLARAELMFHEAAHQWFGDLVTMRWFDDLWLKEGFATFMAYKAIEGILPERGNAWKAFYQRTKPSAYLTDVTKGTTPIYQQIPNLSAAKSAYGNIVYRKAPSMLRQAEFFLEPERFQRAVQLLVKEHAYSNAEWGDLVRAFERTSNRKLDSWADAWVKRRGMADVRARWSADAQSGRINSFALEQRDVLGEGGQWPQRLRVLLAYRNAPPQTLTVTLDNAPVTFVKELQGRPRPDYVFANYEDYGYGRFLLDDVSRAYVLAHLGEVKDDFLRALLWGSLWDSVREAELAPVSYIELGLRHIAGEADEVTTQSILARMATAFNRYLSDAQREKLAPRLEEMIANRMMKAETTGLRITYFRTFQTVATTEAGRGELKKILKGETVVPGLTLRSRDRFDIITALLAQDDKDAPALLDAQAAADTTDDARRYNFAARAAAPDAANKKKYFDSYLNEAKLAESWIEASVNPFNSLRQSNLTLPYLDAALRELPKLKRTRKIFFVNNWLAAFIGGQRSPEALTVVRKFLSASALDPDLRLKVLEAVDGLERSVRIRGKYANERSAS